MPLPRPIHRGGLCIVSIIFPFFIFTFYCVWRLCLWVGGLSSTLRFVCLPPLGLLCLGLTLDWPWTRSYPLCLCTVLLGLYATKLGTTDFLDVPLLFSCHCVDVLRHLGESSSVRLYVLSEYWRQLLMRDVFYETWVDRPFTLMDETAYWTWQSSSAWLLRFAHQISLWPYVSLGAPALILGFHTDPPSCRNAGNHALIIFTG